MNLYKIAASFNRNNYKMFQKTFKNNTKTPIKTGNSNNFSIFRVAKGVGVGAGVMGAGTLTVG
jgi:hypothetical protein